jgi:hypothetical protein
MARQAGLGRSLHDVLESLTPAENLPDAPRRAREQLEADLDRLIDEVDALRDHVQALTLQINGNAALNGASTTVKITTTTKSKKTKPNKAKQAKGDKKSKKHAKA